MTRHRLQQAFGENYMMCCCSYGISHGELIYFHWQGNPILQRTLIGEKRRLSQRESQWDGHMPNKPGNLLRTLMNQPVHRKKVIDGILHILWGFPYLESALSSSINQLMMRLVDGHWTSSQGTCSSSTKCSYMALATNSFKICLQILRYCSS